MKRAALFPSLVVLAWSCASIPSGAQPAAPSNSVATAPKLTSGAIEDFVDAYAAPTLYLGKLARWKNAICPEVSGPDLAGATVIAQRITTIAAKIGAPVSTDSACQTNIEVNFTPVPQKLLDDIRAQRPELVGYSNGEAQARRLATVSHPIQAWYATQWEDNNGTVRPDNSLDQCGGISRSDNSNCTVSGANFGLRTRTSDNRKSEFFNVLVAVDTGKSAGLSIDALADYITMLVLAQPKSFEACQPVPSITNLVSPNCPAGTKVSSLTDADLAYLRGLYKARLDRTFDQQKSEIADEMAKSVAGQ